MNNQKENRVKLKGRQSARRPNEGRRTKRRRNEGLREEQRREDGQQRYDDVVLVATGFFALLYAGMQLYFRGGIADSIFILLTVFNVLLLYIFAIKFRQRITETAPIYRKEIPSRAEFFEPGNLESRLFGEYNIVYGSLFAMPVGVLAFFLYPWGTGNEDNQIILNLSLVLYLVAANLLVGASIASLFKFFKLAQEIGGFLNISLWNRHEKSTVEFVKLHRYLLLSISLIAFLAMLSLISSKFYIKEYIIYFSIFSILVILIAYYVPLLPITRILREQKQGELAKIGRMIAEEYSKISTISTSSNQKSTASTQINLDNIEALRTLKKHVAAVHVFAPLGIPVRRTASALTLLSFAPAAIELLIDNYSKLF